MEPRFITKKKMSRMSSSLDVRESRSHLQYWTLSFSSCTDVILYGRNLRRFLSVFLVEAHETAACYGIDLQPLPTHYNYRFITFLAGAQRIFAHPVYPLVRQEVEPLEWKLKLSNFLICNNPLSHLKV